MVITMLPVLLDADSGQWGLIDQEVDELCQTINSCLLKHQSLSSSTTRSAAEADNPIAQIIHCSLQQISRRARAQSAADADSPITQITRCSPQQISRHARAQSKSESCDTPQETSVSYLRTGEPCEPELWEPEPSSRRINNCVELNEVAGQGSLERTTPPTIHSNVKATKDRRIAPIRNARSTPDSTAGSAVLSHSAKGSDIKYEWDDKVLLLRPSVHQWDDFPALLSYAQGLGAEKVGAFKVEVPEALRYDCPQTPPDSGVRKCVKYRVQALNNNAFRVELTPTTAVFRSSPSSLPDSSSAEQAAERLEELLQSNQKLDGVYYRTDIPVCDSAERTAAGLPDNCIIWPCQGDQLPRTKYKIPGLHSPFCYESADKFGAIFACHVEDFYLHSLNHLHVGRKVWKVIPPAHTEGFERMLKSSDKSIATDCAQFLRHASTYFQRSNLSRWDIPFTLIDQRAHQIVITLPKAYHQGFSTGYTRAEAVNYANCSWTLEGYRSCTSECPDHPITGDLMRFLSSEEEQEEQGDSGDSENGADGNSQNGTIDDTGNAANTKRPSGRGAHNRKRLLNKPTSRAKRQKQDPKQPTAQDDLALRYAHVPRRLIRPSVVIQALKSTKDPELLTRLFYAIAGPDAVCQLRDACLAIREEQRIALPSLPDTVADVVRSLDALDTSLFASSILRRYHLLRLVQHRQALLQTIQARSHKGISLDDSPFNRDESQVLTELLAAAHPDLERPRRLDQASGCYRKLRERMKARLKHGQNWHALSERFGPAVLALVPTGEDVQFTSTE